MDFKKLLATALGCAIAMVVLDFVLPLKTNTDGSVTRI